MNRRRTCLIAFLTSFACSTLGQGTVATGPSASRPPFSVTVPFGGPAAGPPAMNGAPFSGEQVFESVHVLTDGTQVTHKVPGQKMYRDFAGRTRTERFLVPYPPVSSSGKSLRGTPLDDVMVVEIYDPLAGFRYKLDNLNHVTHRQKVLSFTPSPAANFSTASATQPAAVPTPPDEAASSTPKITSESLGTQTINGVPSEGHRTTQTIPAGAQGNDRPINVISESWFSPELRITVLSKTSDPRSGETTTQILNIIRSDPDLSLFTIPADYTVVDETGPFTIRYSRQ